MSVNGKVVMGMWDKGTRFDSTCSQIAGRRSANVFAGEDAARKQFVLFDCGHTIFVNHVFEIFEIKDNSDFGQPSRIAKLP
jgi:hypothetical protein